MEKKAKKQVIKKEIIKKEKTKIEPSDKVKELIEKCSFYYLYEEEKIKLEQIIFLYFYESNLANIAHALRSAGGKSRQTFYNWVDNNKYFAEAVREVKEAQIDVVESQLQKNILKGNQLAIMFYLKTIGKSRGYIERIETDNKIEVVDFEFEEVK
jgi:hypothetical protein